MRKLSILAAFVLVACAAFGQTVVYQNTAMLGWDAVTTQPDGSPLLTGDTVNYQVYFYDRANPPADVQNVALLQYAGATAGTAYEIAFIERREWVVGVRATVTDGGGNAGAPSRVAWSNVEGDVDLVAMGGPFFYTPLVPAGTQAPPTDLRDMRY